jgi:hypothetical protein
MRGLVYGICAAFTVLLSLSIYIAARTYDGPVEKNYYQRSLSFFKDRQDAGAANLGGSLVSSINGERVLLDISPKPVRAMHELVFTVDVPWENLPGRPWIELGMANMAMPPNRVELSGVEGGRYRGKGILVRCPGGMRSWTATVTIPGKGKALFPFDATD